MYSQQKREQEDQDFGVILGQLLPEAGLHNDPVSTRGAEKGWREGRPGVWAQDRVWPGLWDTPLTLLSFLTASSSWCQWLADSSLRNGISHLSPALFYQTLHYSSGVTSERRDGQESRRFQGHVRVCVNSGLLTQGQWRTSQDSEGLGEKPGVRVYLTNALETWWGTTGGVLSGRPSVSKATSAWIWPVRLDKARILLTLAAVRVWRGLAPLLPLRFLEGRVGEEMREQGRQPGVSWGLVPGHRCSSHSTLCVGPRQSPPES